MMNKLRAGKRTAFLAVLSLFFVVANSSPAFGLGTDSSLPDMRAGRSFLVGTSNGLFRVKEGDRGEGITSSYPLWASGSVKKIVAAGQGWYLVTSEGLIFTSDLVDFENRSAGLPVSTTRTISSDPSVPDIIVQKPKTISAFAVDPDDPLRIALCTDSEVFKSDDGGQSWLSLGSPTSTPGYKAISFGPEPSSELFVAHSYKGVFEYSSANPSWTNVSTGLPEIYGTIREEVSSFALIPLGSSPQAAPAAQNPRYQLWAGLSFLGRLFSWDPSTKRFQERWTDGAGFGTIESLSPVDSGHLEAIEAGPAPTGAAVSFSIDRKQKVSASRDESAESLALRIGTSVDGTVLCVLEEGRGPSSSGAAAARASSAATELLRVNLDEAWLLTGRRKGTEAAARRAEAVGKIGIYLQTGFVIDPVSRAKYFDLVKAKGIDAIVVDAKDDSGRLRFIPKSPLLASMGQIGSALDIESFVREAKSRGLYLIARIVVFKDESLYGWKDGELAVRDSKTGLPWRGTKPATGQNAPQTPQLIDEYWVDPYSPSVWRYNVEIAKEVLARGFDEVQFDYIRFPTDGQNIQDAWFPAMAEGMDHVSAIESFLRYARQEISAPISIDIYGSNGWYRTGSRTGQDVEMLSKYVDVFCPMLYPSHFEQDFLAYDPPEKRPYRIYMRGTLRNYRIAREASIVRPYVQAFWLNVSYDRKYYDPSYVVREIEGVVDGANQGKTFWNNSGRYTDLPDHANAVTR